MIPKDCREDPPAPFHPAYFEVRFKVPQLPEVWPRAFAIVTAYATTGATWSQERNEAADRSLREHLAHAGLEGPILRITGYSPRTGHEEPGWLVPAPLDQALAIGRHFQQESIYWVEGGRLEVVRCAGKGWRQVVDGRFFDRIDHRENHGTPGL